MQVHHFASRARNSHLAPALSIRNMVMLFGGLQRTLVTEVPCQFAFAAL